MSLGSPQNDAVGQFFSDFAQTWDTLYGGKRNAFWRWFDSVFRRDVYERYQLTFDRLGQDLRGRRMLDIGCGSGVYCFEAARRGATQVVGVDAALNMIAHARDTAAAQGWSGVCEFHCEGFPSGSLVPAEPFDWVIVMGVMDYVASPAEFLRGVRAVTAGAAVFSFPGSHWLRAPLRKWRYRLLGRPSVFKYREWEIRDLLAAAGFRRVDVNRLDHSGICYIVTAWP